MVAYLIKKTSRYSPFPNTQKVNRDRIHNKHEYIIFH